MKQGRRRKRGTWWELEAIAIHGPDIKPPSYHEVRVPLLKLEKEHTKKLLILNETQKKAIGCSLMADGWRDRKGRALINFLVNTPRGSMFLESVDASSYSHTGTHFSCFLLMYFTYVYIHCSMYFTIIGCYVLY